MINNKPKQQKANDNIKKAKVINFIESLFKHFTTIILTPNTIKINNKKFDKILLVSDIDNFYLKCNEIIKSKDFPLNLEKKNLKVFLTINDNAIIELLDD